MEMPTVLYEHKYIITYVNIITWITFGDGNANFIYLNIIYFAHTYQFLIFFIIKRYNYNNYYMKKISFS